MYFFFPICNNNDFKDKRNEIELDYYSTKGRKKGQRMKKINIIRSAFTAPPCFLNHPKWLNCETTQAHL